MQFDDGEALVRLMVETLPEAFEGVDLAREYGPDEFGGHGWLVYIAFQDLRRWVEEQTLVVDFPARATVVLRPEPLERYLALVERLARDGDDRIHTLLMVDAFEGIPWVEDVLDGRVDRYPHLRALLDKAQVQFADTNSAIGRWADPRA